MEHRVVQSDVQVNTVNVCVLEKNLSSPRVSELNFTATHQIAEMLPCGSKRQTEQHSRRWCGDTSWNSAIVLVFVSHYVPTLCRNRFTIHLTHARQEGGLVRKRTKVELRSRLVGVAVVPHVEVCTGPQLVPQLVPRQTDTCRVRLLYITTHQLSEGRRTCLQMQRSHDATMCRQCFPAAAAAARFSPFL